MIVCFGSLNADLIFRLPEVPRSGQTLLADDLAVQAGGKGANQAVAAARDGAAVAMVGAVGSDALAEVALSGLREAGADTARVRAVAAATGCASIWIDAQGRNRIVVALGANGHTRADQVADADLARATSLLLQMEVDPAETTALLRRARALGLRSILNLAPALPLDLDTMRLAGLLVVNEDEAEATAARLGCAPEAASLHAALGIDVVRTLGEAGSEAATESGAWHVPARAVEPVDTTAAGDCFVGVLAAALDRGTPLRAAMERASVAAALACGRRGSQASLPWREETDRALGT
ncbi:MULTISPECIES: ribokinase [Methylobacterium]|uniref:Ribokinase n=2 Tax=Methylobacterium TaxID=407 RepID=A0A0C6FQW3_9HYPH|nr:ribokinase [Methylobacterium aquaticum]BAQ47684.1 sugar kinases, ribokinase family [Methylobacterium aquaticum]